MLGGYENSEDYSRAFVFHKGAFPNGVTPVVGEGNLSSTQFCFVGNGIYNKAQGLLSLATGAFAEATNQNEWAGSSGGFQETPGVAQHSVINLRMNSNTAGKHPLATTGSKNAPQPVLPPSNSVHQFVIYLALVVNSGANLGKAWAGIFEGVARRRGAFLTEWIGGIPTLRDVHQESGFNPNVQFSFLNGAIRAEFDGITAVSVVANMTVFTNQVKFGIPGYSIEEEEEEDEVGEE